MGAHQVSYVVVAQRIRVQLVCAEDISFAPIRAKTQGVALVALPNGGSSGQLCSCSAAHIFLRLYLLDALEP
eukprot:scaffold1013_cov161-Skeletonema_menzelii.AAC.7